jgi:DNA processing protein
VISERDAWIALDAVPGVGDLTFERLLEIHGSAAAALEATARLSARGAGANLGRQLGIRVRKGLAASIAEAAQHVAQPQQQIAALGGWVLTPLDHDYPARLLELEQPPRVLYGLGRKAALSRPRMVAVVGTRQPTPSARDLAGRIGARLSASGAVVVSGLAVGIDGAAHRAALEADGETVAVVGSGLDDPAPAAHRSLARAIAASGTVVGELAPGVRATKGTFPRRNRIISALSSATIVVEAPARSGALITARHALEQGRDVLVAPGRPLDRRIAGNLALLRESPAMPLVGLDEMVMDLGFDQGSGDTGPARQLGRAAALASLGEHERAVATVLSGGPHSIDDLCRRCRLPAGVVSSALTILQLRGWARVMGAIQLPAGPLLDAEPAA